LFFSEFEKEDVVLMASLASSVETGDPIDLAVIEYAKSTGVGVSDYAPISFTPFDPKTKRSEAIVEHGSSGSRLSRVPHRWLCRCVK
jgi:H+-transporting ATPase